MIRPVLAAAVLAALTACTPSAAAPVPPPAAHAEPATPAPAAPAAPAEQHVAAQSGCHVVDGRADARCTPGVRNPQVTQENIASTICKSGWTATVRPPASVTDALKVQQMRAYGETGSPSEFEEDHEIAIEIGGNPTDPLNLWPQPRSGPHPASEKDAEENSLHRAVCGGRMKLADAQAQILAHWTHP